ncbi:hypothetical protein ESY86_13770 [Subsaximicrobium wynnwilliamsii]|uniref:Uncharacterized protein n=1 Tax=Subsaximicrobium wynnwilliamsii TaxID=291179 RepID=A0A5C6ZG27_9FLAO|nr:hypothetical protein [Subsaximicrobium wynnwilliamsii]TXD82520.1 hypothetical protein ESY87_13365 [Subsaximicrobium wynnwilliamsii]TXD88163.1 hypothetical protein ESY86_13770 [Subsaximicrobium wynnwilliamsii]TXE02178.1 hypothetical protein ESY88_12935 [Subsaximicrobium wynnwilliamsii]
MRNLVIILFFLAANLGSASVEKNETRKNYDNYEDATIHFLDGASVRGYGKIISTFKSIKSSLRYAWMAR